VQVAVVLEAPLLRLHRRLEQVDLDLEEAPPQRLHLLVEVLVVEGLVPSLPLPLPLPLPLLPWLELEDLDLVRLLQLQLQPQQLEVLVVVALVPLPLPLPQPLLLLPLVDRVLGVTQPHLLLL
jgi:hypothetical protein